MATKWARWLVWAWFALIVPMVLANSAHAQAHFQASFDCNKARGKIENTICAFSGLAALDLELANEYARASSQAVDTQALISSQRQWIATRNACDDIGCLRDQYTRRIAELRALASSPQTGQARPAVSAGQQVANCDLFAAHPFDPGKRAAGVSYGDLQPSAAIDACSAAVAAQPNEGRLHFQLGRALEKANQLPEAISAYQRAAQLGHPGGYSNLGELYRDGKGVARNPQLAEQNFRQAAAKGFPEAQFSLANMILAQSRSAGNVDQARQLLQSAANGGYAAANDVLSTLQPVATRANSIGSVGLLALAGRYATVSAVGKPANCEKNDFTLSFNGDQLTFVERNGKRHVERILNFAGDVLDTQVVSSPDVAAGTTYRYTVFDTDNLSVRNLGSGAAFGLSRCASSAYAQTAPTADQTAALARQQSEAAQRERQAEAQRLAEDAARERHAVAERERQAAAQRAAEEARQREQAAELERQAAAKREADLQAQIVATQKVAEEQQRTLLIGVGAALALVLAGTGVAISIKRKRVDANTLVGQSDAAPQSTKLPAMVSDVLVDEERAQSPPQPPPEAPPLSVAEAASLLAAEPGSPSFKIADDADALLSEQMKTLFYSLKVRSVWLQGSNVVSAAKATVLSRLPHFVLSANATLVIEDTATNLLAPENATGIRVASELVLAGTNTVSADQAQRLTILPRLRVRDDAALELSDTTAAILSSSNAGGIKLATRVVITGSNTVDPAQATHLAKMPHVGNPPRT